MEHCGTEAIKNKSTTFRIFRVSHLTSDFNEYHRFCVVTSRTLKKLNTDLGNIFALIWYLLLSSLSLDQSLNIWKIVHNVIGIIIMKTDFLIFLIKYLLHSSQHSKKFKLQCFWFLVLKKRLQFPYYALVDAYL